jgi:hypothetical protein
MIFETRAVFKTKSRGIGGQANNTVFGKRKSPLEENSSRGDEVEVFNEISQDLAKSESSADASRVHPTRPNSSESLM